MLFFIIFPATQKIAAHVLGLCVRAGFGAQSFNLLLMFIRSTQLQDCTSARLTQNPCACCATKVRMLINHYCPTKIVKK